jgi:chromosome segregation ATPase
MSVRTRDVNEPLSRLHEEMRQGFIDMRAEMRQSLIEVRTEMHEGLAAVRGEMRRGFADVQQSFADVQQRFAELHQGMAAIGQRLETLDERVRADGVLLEALRDQMQQLAEAHAILAQRLERCRREHEVAQQEILALLRTSYQDLERRVSRLEARIGESGPAV